MSLEENITKAIKSLNKMQAEREWLARKCFERAKSGDKTWSDLMASGEGHLVGILAAQAFAAGYNAAIKHMMANELTNGIPDLAKSTRGNYTDRELREMTKEGELKS